ncbi:QWRF motif-containing protein 7 isoform X2 [Dendrobium catenatum]|uniref:QWRF motif-containing protein 7 isoform X2 n=1 Tax=Dendrobium catenatum TaxID=906689 RepID=UPI0009F364A0|nr:QWRF motif-containing protein 7 isoform X2 [Dendrobium catenatum]
MDKRRSISRVVSHGFRPAGAAATSICPSSPSSGGESPTNTTSTLHSRSPRRRKHFPETPRKVLRKQRSAEDLQLRGGLWPSAKNQPGAPNTNVIAATLQDHLINDRKNEEEEEELRIVGFETHAASTFSSRQRARSNSSAFEINISNGRGRRYRPSLSSSASKKKKKQPGTPPSPSSSSSSSSSFSGPNIPSAARLPFSDENALAERRSEFGLDFPSTESDHRDAGANSRSRAPIKIAGKVVRRSGSPVRRSKSPVMRNSRSPPVPRNSRSPPVLRQPTSPAKEMISGGMGKIISMGLGGLFRRKSFSGSGVTLASTTTTTKSSISVAKETANNRLSGRRGMAEVVGSPARGAQAAVELQHELRMAHNHLMQWRFVNARTVAINSNKWAMAQIKAMERWVNYMEKHHMAAISSTKDCLHAVVCRLPLTDRAKADPQILSILMRKATNLMAAINGNIAACVSMTNRTVPLVAQLAQLISKEKPLIEECFELLEFFSELQFREESLRCHLIQLKS